LAAAVNTTNVIFQTIHAAFETEGFTPEVRKLTESTINLAVNTVKMNPKLSELLKKIDANRDSFLSWHSTALAFLACKLTTLLDWSSEGSFYRLSLSALLHDITLQKDEHSKIQEAEELAAANLTEEEAKLVRSHPTDSAKLLASFPELPGEVAFIVE